MNDELRVRLESFLRPLYQDLDGASRFDEVSRVARIARLLHRPATAGESRCFELLLMFHGLGRWLEKVGNLSRVTLSIEGVTEEELRETAASIRHLPSPRTEPERALSAALMIDSAGVRGLTEQFTRARREGSSVMDVVRAAVSDAAVPDWLPPRAGDWLAIRRDSRREVCRRILEEIELGDLGPS